VPNSVRGFGQADWLRRRPPARNRRWALEEQLLGPSPAPEELVAAEPGLRSIGPPRGDVHSDESYVLGHCHDFTVVDRHGETAYVSDARFLSRADRPDELEVSSRGRLARRAWIPVSEVEHLSSEQEQITLSCELSWSHRRHVTRQLIERARAVLH
jgi:hypothetical protein